MAIERRNPLPPGMYSITVFRPSDSAPFHDDHEEIFNAWAAAAGLDKVKIHKVERIPEPALGGPRSTFFVFSVIQSVHFPNAVLGFPDITTDPNAPAELPEPDVSIFDLDFGKGQAGLGSGALLLLLAYMVFGGKD